MARHKTRVTRRGRCKARTGTRKQSGGFLHLFNPLNWFKKTDPTTTMVTGGVPAAAPGATTPAPAPGATPPTPDAAVAPPDKPWGKVWGGGSRRKSRKTRHRRRRHHRK
jgi:hypothetical protein